MSERLVLALSLLAYVSLLLVAAGSRSYVGYGVETDYLGSFVPDAKLLLAGEPMASRYHPYLYPMVLALSYLLIGDWVQVGLLVSLVSGVVALLAAHRLFGLLGTEWTAWGAIVAMFGSTPFMTYSLQATSDVFFLAVLLLALLCAVIAMRGGKPLPWAACGVVTVLAMMTRTNAITLLLLGIAPMLTRQGGRPQLVGMLAFWGGFAGALGCFLVFATASGSNLWPTETYRFLAAAYFVDVPDALSGDALMVAGRRFDSLLEVLTHDPARLLAGYFSSIYDLAQERFGFIFEPPLNLLFLPGLVLLVGRRWSSPLMLVLVVLGVQIALVCLAPFSARYFLFLVPLAGAGIGELVSRLPREDGWRRRIAIASVSIAATVAVGLATVKSYAGTLADTREIAEAVPAARRHVPPAAAVLTYKPHLPWFLDAEWIRIPMGLGLDGLRTFIDDRLAGRPVYFLVGQAERRMRPEYAGLTPEASPAWLEPVTSGRSPGAWTLYRYRPGHPELDIEPAS